MFRIVVLGLVFMLSIKTWACSCKPPGTVAETVGSLDLVFSGRILSRTETKNHDSLGIKPSEDTFFSENASWLLSPTYPNVLYKVKVDKVLKGKLYSDTITVFTFSGGSPACESSFAIGEKYIIYTYIERGIVFAQDSKASPYDTRTFWTNACIRNSIWHKAEEDEIIKFMKASESEKEKKKR